MYRIAKQGKQKPWTINELKAGFELFYADYSRYPTAAEIDNFKYLPSVRSIERRFGGLVELRNTLKLNTQSDLRIGNHRSNLSFKISARGHKYEQEVHEYLVKRFGNDSVHCEYSFTDDKRTQSDFFVHDAQKGFCVDVLYSANRRNLAGCLNSKQKKYKTESMRQYPVIFLQMNKELKQNILDALLKNKKNNLPIGQYLMTIDTFKIFCESRNPLSVGSYSKPS